MIFLSPGWKMIEKRYPLVDVELKAFKAAIANSALELHWLINWAEAAKNMIERSQEDEMCPDFYYQKSYTPMQWNK